VLLSPPIRDAAKILFGYAQRLYSTVRTVPDTIRVKPREFPIPTAAFSPHIVQGAVREEASMDYVVEAKKFVQRANEADHPEVIKEHLKMADWCLKQAIDERSEPQPGEVPRKSN